MLAARMVPRESFRGKKSDYNHQKKEQCCPIKDQSEMWGIIRKEAAENSLLSA